MSLFTRCPACRTAFKVVRDQLRISDGWVRCGRCGEVFDAAADLQEQADSGGDAGSASSPTMPNPTDARPDAEAQGAATGSTARTGAEGLTGSPALASRSVEPARVLPPVRPGAFVVDPLAPSRGTRSAKDATLDQRSDPHFDAGWWSRQPSLELDDSRVRFEDGSFDPVPIPTMPTLAGPLEPSVPSSDAKDSSSPIEKAVDAQLNKALRRARAKAAKIAKSREKAAAAQMGAAAAPHAQRALAAEAKTDGGQRKRDPTLTASQDVPVLTRASPESKESADKASTSAWPEFMLSPRRAVKPIGARTRRWLFVAIGALLLLLLLQVLQRERNAVAAYAPGLDPLLALMCKATGCSVSPLRRIDEILIDGASFSRESGGDGLRLAFTLRNSANVALAMPSIELTLLDGRQEPVVRRVLTPAEFDAPTRLAARAEHEVSLPLSLDAAADLPPVGGYRLVAFYP